MKLPDYVKKALRTFEHSFINHNNEIILEPKSNVYFHLDDVDSEIDFQCKMFAWVSRPISTAIHKYWSKRGLEDFNSFFEKTFNRDEMKEIYKHLGNDVNRKLTIKFIESGYDMSLLKKEDNE